MFNESPPATLHRWNTPVSQSQNKKYFPFSHELFLKMNMLKTRHAKTHFGVLTYEMVSINLNTRNDDACFGMCNYNNVNIFEM